LTLRLDHVVVSRLPSKEMVIALENFAGVEGVILLHLLFHEMLHDP